MFVKKILIDLDGVLNEYGKGNFDENFIPDIKDGAYEFIEKLSQFADLYLFTTRNLMLSTKWLMKNNLDKFFKDVTNIKIPSYLYIDDRTICFKGDYKNTLDEIRNFFENYKVLQKIDVKVEKYYPKNKALKIIEQSRKNYLKSNGEEK